MGRGTDKPPHGIPQFLFMMKRIYPSAGEIVLLPYDRIISKPLRNDAAYTEAGLADLILSIEENGVLEPIRVSTVEGQYYRIASGERRFRAAVIAGLTEIPSIVIHSSKEEGNVPYALIDELHHRNMHYLERAEALRKTLEEEGYDLYHLSEALSVPMVFLAESLKLLELSPEIRQRIRQNALPEPYAELLLTVEEGQRRGVLDKILAEDFSLTEAKAYVTKQKEPRKRGNIMVFKDLNVFVNTVEHAVETMNRSGIASQIQRTETEERIVYTVTISKNG